MTPANYQANIAQALGVTAARAAAIAAEYPPGNDDSSATAAFTTLVGDASFACPALQIDQLTAQRAPTYAYEFNDDTAPQLFTPPGFLPPVATHGSELPYLFDLPNAPFPPQFTAGQQALAASMRAAWAHFAARGNPATSGRALARHQREQHTDAVARAAPTTTRDRLRHPAPLRILGRRVATPPPPHTLPAAAPTSAAAGRGKESAWTARCRLTFSTAGTSRYPAGPGWDDSAPATWPASTSTLISGDRDAVLVDALLTTGQGERLAVWRKRLLAAAVMTAAAVWGGETDG